MGKRIKRLNIDAISKPNMINLTATPEAMADVMRIEGIEYIAPSKVPNKYLVFVSSLYDFDEIVEEIRACEETVPDAFKEE